MRGLDQLLLKLLDELPPDAGSADGGLSVRVEGVELKVPVEARIRVGGLDASLPRGVLSTGFDVPHSHLRATWARSDR